jgi:iron-sulfur cluster repair protein YtfE (RIC family)
LNEAVAVELKHSQIRASILEEHEQLRARMRELEAGLDAKGDTVGTLFKRFLTDLLRHIDHEEAVLRPVLAQGDAWARLRVEALDREHREQRAKLAELAGLDPSSTPFVERVREALGWIRVDMAGEEKSLLTPEVLRDDIIVIDSFGG